MWNYWSWLGVHTRIVDFSCALIACLNIEFGIIAILLVSMHNDLNLISEFLTFQMLQTIYESQIRNELHVINIHFRFVEYSLMPWYVWSNIDFRNCKLIFGLLQFQRFSHHVWTLIVELLNFSVGVHDMVGHWFRSCGNLQCFHNITPGLDERLIDPPPDPPIRLTAGARSSSAQFAFQGTAQLTGPLPDRSSHLNVDSSASETKAIKSKCVTFEFLISANFAGKIFWESLWNFCVF